MIDAEDEFTRKRIRQQGEELGHKITDLIGTADAEVAFNVLGAVTTGWFKTLYGAAEYVPNGQRDVAWLAHNFLEMMERRFIATMPNHWGNPLPPDRETPHEELQDSEGDRTPPDAA